MSFDPVLGKQLLVLHDLHNLLGQRLLLLQTRHRRTRPEETPQPPSLAHPVDLDL